MLAGQFTDNAQPGKAFQVTRNTGPVDAGGFCGLLVVGCGDKLSVEQHIIASLRAMEEVAEKGEHFEFMGYVVDSFTGQQGSMDRRAFHRFMIFQMNQHRRLHTQFFPIHVQESGLDQASARFNLLVTGGAGLLPQSGQLFAVETPWIHSSGDWLLSAAQLIGTPYNCLIRYSSIPAKF